MVAFAAPALRQNWADSSAIRTRTGFGFKWRTKNDEIYSTVGETLRGKKREGGINGENWIRKCATAPLLPLYRMCTSETFPAAAPANVLRFVSSA